MLRHGRWVPAPRIVFRESATPKRAQPRICSDSSTRAQSIWNLHPRSCDAAILMLDTGLEPGEAISLEWADIHRDYLEVAGRLHSRSATKAYPDWRARCSRNGEAKRIRALSFSGGRNDRAMRDSSVALFHAETRRKLKLPEPLFYTIYGTRR
jgi:integrase